MDLEIDYCYAGAPLALLKWSLERGLLGCCTSV